MINKKLASTLAFSMPKIGLISSALEQQSIGIIAKTLSMPKIDTQVLESLYTDEKIITFQNDIKILNDKIESKELFTIDDWKKYFNIVKELFYIFVAFISIYAFIFPDNIEMKKLQKEFNILSSSIQNEISYEVVRTVNIRDYPNSSNKTKILDVVFPKQKLLLLDRKSKWIEVEYFSNKKQETITGWVYKKYTKKRQ